MRPASFKRVKANGGAAGADGVTLQEFERDLKRNLYRIWNRLSSGSYFAPPVKRVEMRKEDGKIRPLGIPTVGDRIAQMVVKQRLEPVLEPLFDKNSYGYRPNRSAHDALRVVRKQCWKHDWVLDLDIKGFFDNLDWKLLMKAHPEDGAKQDDDEHAHDRGGEDPLGQVVRFVFVSHAA